MTVKIPKCRSKIIPCPAGDRCPEHRGLAKALADAAGRGDFDSYLQIRGESEQVISTRRNEALSDSFVKKNHKGDIIVTLPEVKTVFFHKTKPTSKVTLYTKKRPKVNLGTISPVDLVDKTKSINSSWGLSGARQSFAEAVTEVYDGNAIFIKGKGEFDVLVVDDIQVSDDYKNKGVEEHILGSFVMNSRRDLYSFAGTDKLPYEVYKAQGFEPNPYYFAGKTHQGTGTTYPTVAKLDELSEDAAGSWRNLSAAKGLETFPYIRLKYGRRVSDIPLTPATNFTPAMFLDLATKEGLREAADTKAARNRSLNFDAS